MKGANFDIDQIVQMVWADLSVRAEPIRVEPEPIVPAENEIYLDNRVISLTDIRKVLGDVKKLTIPAKSILTPSAKDEIRKRKIEIAVRLPLSSVGRKSSFWLAIHAPARSMPKLSERLKKEFDLEQGTFDSIAGLIDETGRKLTNEKTLGLAMSPQAARLLCFANRRETIRAIHGTDPKQTSEDAKELDANLLVIHPERVGEFRIWEILQSFVKHN